MNIGLIEDLATFTDTEKGLEVNILNKTLKDTKNGKVYSFNELKNK